jgi:hypothetical protein
MLLLFVAIGISVALIVYQIGRQPLTVSSVATLNYEVAGESVTDLTAPDGSELDLNQLKSSYVLRNALKEVNLSENVPIEDIQDSISIEKILTEESQRQQEIASKKVEDKSLDAYQAVEELDLKYKNMFIVSLRNRFGREKIELTEGEVRELLDSILKSYNTYLLDQYPSIRLPDDEIAAIQVGNIDILESLDQLRESMRHLYNYCNNVRSDVKSYRSTTTGRTLTDWMEELETFQEVSIDYLYAFVYLNNIGDKETALIKSESELVQANTDLEKIIGNIATLDEILNSYKSDKVYVTSLVGDAERSKEVTTEYYNELILQQVNNYAKMREIETTIANLEYRIEKLENKESSKTEAEQTEQAEAEFAGIFDSAHTLYKSIEDHIKEIMSLPLYQNYTEHSAAIGETENFIVASKKNLILGAGLAALTALVFWFAGGLAPEFKQREEETAATQKEEEKKSGKGARR